MAPSRRAVIDIGTNSVKLLVADVAGSGITPVLERAEQTRLGGGLYRTRRLQPEAIERTVGAVTRFAAEAARHQAARVRIIATSAAREAENRTDLIAAIERATGYRPDVISGEQEADWAFQGVCSDPGLADRSLLILDVGGGSSEFILGRGSQSSFRQSFPLGTVRGLDEVHPADPPTAPDWQRCLDWIRTILDRQVAPALESALAGANPAPQFIGTSGTASILASIARGTPRFERALIDGTTLPLAQVTAQRRLLWELPLARRQQVPGLPAERADVMLIGIAVYETVMDRFRLPDLRISVRGLRYAALMEPPN